MRIIILTLSVSAFLFSCEKELNLPNGNYTGNFYGDVVEQKSGIPSGKHHNSTNLPISISNVSNSSITINGMALQRRENIIEGVIYVGEDYGIQPAVSGTIIKEKKSYRIEGVYKAQLTPYWQEEYDVFAGYVGGDFEIVPL